MLPYVSGEIPALGDRVSGSSNRTGTVTRFLFFGDDPELVVEWDDGTTGIRYQAADFVLVERAAKETVSVPH
jgi:hypothetical protein